MPEFEAVTLKDPSSSLTATFVPAAGMIGTSLADDGVEFLGQRRGLDAYVTSGKTMGIPILYPWANRLSASKYGINGAVVTLTAGTGGVRTDEHGVPIHGVLAAYPGWLVTARSDEQADGRARLRRQAAPAGVVPVPARADPGGHARRPHADHRDDRHADHGGVGAAVLRLPPVSARSRACRARSGCSPRRTCGTCPVDNWGIPTGEHEDWNGATEPLETIAYDDGFDKVPDGSVFALAGGDRRVEVKFEKGYPGGADLRAAQRRRRRHRADGGARPMRCAAATTASRSRASRRRRASRSR